MNASKENARKTLAYVNVMAGYLDSKVGMPEGSDILLEHVRGFLQAAERKLPSEAAYQSDKDRRNPSVEDLDSMCT